MLASGTKVSWTSQSMGVWRAKTGEVVAFIPAGRNIWALWQLPAGTPRSRCKVGSDVSSFDRYVVRVVGPTGLDYYYVPRSGLVKPIQEAPEGLPAPAAHPSDETEGHNEGASWQWLTEIARRAWLRHQTGIGSVLTTNELKMYACIVELRDALQALLKGAPGAREMAETVLAAWATGNATTSAGAVPSGGNGHRH